MRVTVVGAGLAGCEAVWALSKHAVPVTLCEMKPKRFSAAHRSGNFAELVCSNSFKAERTGSAAGLLKAEMERMGSLIIPAARETAVPAGGALAVDREAFSELVTKRILALPGVDIRREEVREIPEGPVILATGPLTSDALSESIAGFVGRDSLSFFDASAPIVSGGSIDYSRVHFASRYGRGTPDYVNCPFDRAEYEAFWEALVHAETVELRDFEKDRFPVYEGCMPIETLAKRGRESMRFGPLRPVGLADPKTGRRPWANVQLRRDNREGSLYNLVGFQTNLKFPEQKRVFRMIPGLEEAEFQRYGVMHRNTFIDSPRLLDDRFALRGEPRIRFAGQMTGVEGYLESAASGIVAGHAAACGLLGRPMPPLPAETMIGSLCRYISDGSVRDFQPMGANMGILPPLAAAIRNREERGEAMAARSLEALDRFLAEGVCK